MGVSQEIYNRVFDDRTRIRGRMEAAEKRVKELEEEPLGWAQNMSLLQEGNRELTARVKELENMPIPGWPMMEQENNRLRKRVDYLEQTLAKIRELLP